MGIKSLVASLVDNIRIPAAFAGLFKRHRYKVFYGGRDAAKSWAFADVLLTMAMQRRLDVLCVRELQVSIKDSVHKLLKRRIEARGLGDFFKVTETNIVGINGSLFSFKGLRHNTTEIKSFEGVDICWVEEAQKVSQESWDLLIPTIRKAGSEIWVSFNPGTPHDPTWVYFVLNTPPDTLLVKVTWRDNPWHSDVMEQERLACLERDPGKYRWIWEGEPRVITDAQIFKDRWRVEEFDMPSSVRLYQGADWGFAADPSTLVRGFMRRAKDGRQEICVSHEAWAKGLELQHLPGLYMTIPDSRRWPIIADPSRPELIKYMRRQGFIIKGAKKWSGSVEDGNAVLRSFGLVIHPRCERTIEEMQLYAYKVDPLTDEVLPVIVDANNHCCDGLRYGFEPVIRGKVGKAA